MKPKKSLGQNFIRCGWVVDTMVRAAHVSSMDTILEIGPGTGALTRAIARAAKKVIAVEKDEGLAQALRKSFVKEGIQNVEIIEGDILEFPKKSLKDGDFKIIANIPYYLTSRLFRHFLEKSPRPELMVLTIQKEVADRIAAKKGDMSLLALSVQAFGKPEKIKMVPSECFSPAPDVTSAIIRISDISNSFFKKNNIDEKKFFEVAREAFSKKRKMLSSSLKKKISEEQFIQAKIEKKSRPQELGIEEWGRLSKIL